MLAIIISVVCMLAIVVIDQISKYLIVLRFDMIQQIYVENIAIEKLEPIIRKLDPMAIIPGVLNFRLVLNDGMALGLLDDARWVFMTLSSVAIVAILVYMFWKKPKNKPTVCAPKWRRGKLKAFPARPPRAKQ